MSAVAGERPILFSAPMVRAIINGDKTQTRRIVQMRDAGQRLGVEYHADVHMWAQREDGAWDGGCWSDGGPATMVAGQACPYGKPGDMLWVRETWAQKADGARVVAYNADGQIRAPVDIGGEIISANRGWLMGHKEPDLNREGHWQTMAAFGGKWRPSIFMPRWASRLTLRVTSVRVERLQDISEADAEAEGVERDMSIGEKYLGEPAPKSRPKSWRTAREKFSSLWDEINGDRGAWASNPWVWVVSFERVGGPS